MPTTQAKPQTKSDTVIALLDRAKDATLDEICKATNWQTHSARAFMTGQRKKSIVLAWEQRGDEGTIQRFQITAAGTRAAGSYLVARTRYHRSHHGWNAAR